MQPALNDVVSRDFRLERRLFVVLGAIALIYAFIAALSTVGDPDFGWQLARGRWIVQHRQVFSTDVLSYTIPGVPAVYPALGGVLLYGVYVLGGYALLCWICALACAATVALLLRRGNAVTAAIAILIVPFMAMRMVPRAEMPAIPLFAAYVSLLWEHYETGRARLWLLPLLMAVWVNVHFSFFAGFGLLAAFAGLDILDLPFAGERRVQALQRLTRKIPWYLATAAATLVNPWGWKIYKDTFQYTGAALSIYVSEWAPLHWNQGPSFSLRNTNDLSHLLLLIILLAIASALLQRRLGPAILLAVTLYEASQHLRYMALASCLLVIIAGAVLYSTLPWIRGRIRSPRAREILATAAAVVFATIGVVRAKDVVTNYHYIAERSLSTFGTGLAPWFPRRAADFIQNQNLPGEVFNTFDEGGYTLWALGPQRRDYIDGREIPFGAAFINHELQLLHTPLDSELWRKEADRYGINTLIFSLIMDEVPLTLLKTDCDSKEWRPVYLDEVSIVFVRSKPENEDLIRRFEVDCATASLPRNPLPLTTTSFHPLLNASRMLFALSRNAEALSASDKAIAIFPGNAHACWYRGQILYTMRRDDEAEEEWTRALALAPGEATPWGSLREFQSVVWASLADLYSHQMRVKDATHSYQEVIRLAPDPISRARAMVDLGTLDHRIGQDPDAEKLWATALVQLPNEGSVWLWLGDLYQQQRRWPAAVHAFEQGVSLTADPTAKSRALIQLGRLYLITQQPQAALQALDEAMRNAPPSLMAVKEGRSFDFDLDQGRAAAWSALGNLKQATSFEEQAVTLDPEAADAWSHLAKLYERQGRSEEQRCAEERGRVLVSNGGTH
jgi:tetratricopeptide (TPR) repeat protein